MQGIENSSSQFSQKHKDDFKLEKGINGTDFPSKVTEVSLEGALLGVPLGLLILFTIMGNAFVIYAIATEKRLKKKSYKLIMSLAFADLMVAILSMPISLYSEIYNNASNFSIQVCEILSSLNAAFSASSILHLLAIATDRYWIITNVDYAISPSQLRVYLLIGGAWVTASLVTTGPILGLKNVKLHETLEKEPDCYIPMDAAYSVFAVFSIFCVPLIIISVLYWKIFKHAKHNIRCKPGKLKTNIVIKSKFKQNSGEEYGVSDTTHSGNGIPDNQDGVSMDPDLNVHDTEIPKESIEDKRERKVARVLLIISCAFFGCWAPFMTVFLLRNVFSSFNQIAYNIALWLTYANSAVNPIIYTIFLPDFRNLYKKILHGLTVRCCI